MRKKLGNRTAGAVEPKRDHTKLWTEAATEDANFLTAAKVRDLRVPSINAVASEGVLSSKIARYPCVCVWFPDLFPR